MAIRKYTNPRALDVSDGLQDVLRRNGLKAHISEQPDGSLKLVVVGHDSPILRYDINDQQAEKLMNWGNTYANKTAYNTLTDIIRKDFDMPDGFVAARNVGGRVVTGLHGYRIGNGEYGYQRRGVPFFRPFDRHTRGWGGDFIGWAPRMQPGWHLRRMGNEVFIADRPDGRTKPGELRSGAYGFYYKGQQRETKQDVLDDVIVNDKLKPLQGAERPEPGKAKPYKDLVTSPVYFTAAKWKECLDSHGIEIKGNGMRSDGQVGKVMIIKSADARVDLKYDLNDDEYEKLTKNTITGEGSVSIKDRLDIINEIASQDFENPVTMEMLNSKEIIDIKLKPEVREDVEKKFIQRDKEIAAQERRLAEQRAYSEAAGAERQRLQEESVRIARDPQAINGREIHEIMGDKGFFAARYHGRDLVVGEIRVDETAEKNFVMSAEINGAVVTHSISKKDFDRFIQLDDKHRLMLFNDVFKEVEIKNDYGGRDFTASPILNIKDENGQYITREQADIENSRSNTVDGSTLRDIKNNKGFYREIENGREVAVEQIAVNKIAEDNYRMTAVIDGVEVSHDISQKQFDKFMAVDDYQRMKMFSKVFPEVDMKTRPGMGVNVGAAILAAVVAGTELIHDFVGMPGQMMPPPPRRDCGAGNTIYAKPGVVSPSEVAQAAYAEHMAVLHDEDNDRGVGRGM